MGRERTREIAELWLRLTLQGEPETAVTSFRQADGRIDVIDLVGGPEGVEFVDAELFEEIASEACDAALAAWTKRSGTHE